VVPCLGGENIKGGGKKERGDTLRGRGYGNAKKAKISLAALFGGTSQWYITYGSKQTGILKALWGGDYKKRKEALQKKRIQFNEDNGVTLAR